MLLEAARSSLLLVDIQERLAPAIHDGSALIERARILLAAADRLRIPITVTEQYPQGLGPTDARLLPLPHEARIFAKTCFSATREPAIRTHLDGLHRPQLVVAGMEAHICVLQSALELQESGFDVFVCADATGSRRVSSRDLGLARLRDRGVDVVDVEMVLFEWLGAAGTDTFRELSRLIR
jgi:nicotinamidase-related amidase